MAFSRFLLWAITSHQTDWILSANNFTLFPEFLSYRIVQAQRAINEWGWWSPTQSHVIHACCIAYACRACEVRSRQCSTAKLRCYKNILFDTAGVSRSRKKAVEWGRGSDHPVAERRFYYAGRAVTHLCVLRIFSVPSRRVPSPLSFYPFYINMFHTTGVYT